MSEPRKKPSFKLRIEFLVAAICIAFIFLAVIAIPNCFDNRRYTSSANACIDILRQIDAAANEFALEHHLTNGDAINYPNDLTPYIHLNKDGKIPSCPKGGIYSIKKVGESPTCSLGTNVTPAHVLP